MGSPSFLAHQRRPKEGQRRTNCQTLFAMTAIPTDPHIRAMPDGTEHVCVAQDGAEKQNCERPPASTLPATGGTAMNWLMPTSVSSGQ